MLGIYRRRRPERTLAWQTVQGWLATWIAYHDEADAESVPAYVQRELSAYLECGILAHGFARARCPDCTAEFLVAFLAPVFPCRSDVHVATPGECDLPRTRALDRRGAKSRRYSVGFRHDAMVDAFSPIRGQRA